VRTGQSSRSRRRRSSSWGDQPVLILRGASDAIELVLAAHELGMDAIGIADRNSLAGVVRMHSAAKGAGLRP
jgi:error-prone DNA polymerase